MVQSESIYKMNSCRRRSASRSVGPIYLCKYTTRERDERLGLDLLVRPSRIHIQISPSYFLIATMHLYKLN